MITSTRKAVGLPERFVPCAGLSVSPITIKKGEKKNGGGGGGGGTAAVAI